MEIKIRDSQRQMFSQEESKREKRRVSDKKASTPHNADPVLDYQNFKPVERPTKRGFSSKARHGSSHVSKVPKILPQSSAETLISISSATYKQKSNATVGQKTRKAEQAPPLQMGIFAAHLTNLDSHCYTLSSVPNTKQEESERLKTRNELKRFSQTKKQESSPSGQSNLQPIQKDVLYASIPSVSVKGNRNHLRPQSVESQPCEQLQQSKSQFLNGSSSKMNKEDFIPFQARLKTLAPHGRSHAKFIAVQMQKSQRNGLRSHRDTANNTGDKTLNPYSVGQTGRRLSQPDVKTTQDEKEISQVNQQKMKPSSREALDSHIKTSRKVASGQMMAQNNAHISNPFTDAVVNSDKKISPQPQLRVNNGIPQIEASNSGNKNVVSRQFQISERSAAVSTQNHNIGGLAQNFGELKRNSSVLAHGNNTRSKNANHFSQLVAQQSLQSTANQATAQFRPNSPIRKSQPETVTSGDKERNRSQNFKQLSNESGADVKVSGTGYTSANKQRILRQAQMKTVNTSQIVLGQTATQNNSQPTTMTYADIQVTTDGSTNEPRHQAVYIRDDKNSRLQQHISQTVKHSVQSSVIQTREERLMSVPFSYSAPPEDSLQEEQQDISSRQKESHRQLPSQVGLSLLEIHEQALLQSRLVNKPKQQSFFMSANKSTEQEQTSMKEYGGMPSVSSQPEIKAETANSIRSPPQAPARREQPVSGDSTNQSRVYTKMKTLTSQLQNMSLGQKSNTNQTSTELVQNQHNLQNPASKAQSTSQNVLPETIFRPTVHSKIQDSTSAPSQKFQPAWKSVRGTRKSELGSQRTQEGAQQTTSQPRALNTSVENRLADRSPYQQAIQSSNGAPREMIENRLAEGGNTRSTGRQALNNSQSIENERNRIYDVVNSSFFGPQNLGASGTSQNNLFARADSTGSPAYRGQVTNDIGGPFSAQKQVKTATNRTTGAQLNSGTKPKGVNAHIDEKIPKQSQPHPLNSVNSQIISSQGQIHQFSNNGNGTTYTTTQKDSVSNPRSLYQTHQGGKYNFITPMILSDLHQITHVQQNTTTQSDQQPVGLERASLEESKSGVQSPATKPFPNRSSRKYDSNPRQGGHINATNDSKLAIRSAAAPYPSKANESVQHRTRQEDKMRTPVGNQTFSQQVKTNFQQFHNKESKQESAATVSEPQSIQHTDMRAWAGQGKQANSQAMNLISSDIRKIPAIYSGEGKIQAPGPPPFVQKRRRLKTPASMVQTEYSRQTEKKPKEQDAKNVPMTKEQQMIRHQHRINTNVQLRREQNKLNDQSTSEFLQACRDTGEEDLRSGSITPSNLLGGNHMIYHTEADAEKSRHHIRSQSFAKHKKSLNENRAADTNSVTSNDPDQVSSTNQQPWMNNHQAVKTNPSEMQPPQKEENQLFSEQDNGTSQSVSKPFESPPRRSSVKQRLKSRNGKQGRSSNLKRNRMPASKKKTREGDLNDDQIDISEEQEDLKHQIFDEETKEQAVQEKRQKLSQHSDRVIPQQPSDSEDPSQLLKIEGPTDLNTDDRDWSMRSIVSTCPIEDAQQTTPLQPLIQAKSQEPEKLKSENGDEKAGEEQQKMVPLLGNEDSKTKKEDGGSDKNKETKQVATTEQAVSYFDEKRLASFNKHALETNTQSEDPMIFAQQKVAGFLVKNPLNQRFVQKEKGRLPYSVFKPHATQVTFLKSIFEGRPPVAFFQYPSYVGIKRVADRIRQYSREEVEHLFMSFRISDSTHIYNAVVNSCKAAGFNMLESNTNLFNVQWTGYIGANDIKNLNKYQKTNHFPGSSHLGRKDLLWRNMNRMRSKFPKDFIISPMSYQVQEEHEAFNAERERDKNALWILKPVAASCGRGIKIVNSIQRVNKREGYLACKYIANPHLLNGLKYDLRVYVLVTSFNPLRVYMYNDGLVRFATEKYSNDPRKLAKKYVHLTNFSINKKNMNFVKNTDKNKQAASAATATTGNEKIEDEDQQEFDQNSSKWDFKMLRAAYENLGINYEYVIAQFKDLIVKTLLCVEPHVTQNLQKNPTSRNNCFELYGFDILVDSNFKPWVLEVNVLPSLSSSSPFDKRIKTMLICDTLTLVGIRGYDKQKFHSQTTELLGLAPFAQSMTVSELRQKPRLQGSEKLTKDELEMLMDLDEEFMRRGNFQRIFPLASNASFYEQFFDTKRYQNALCASYLTSPQHIRDQLLSKYRRIYNSQV